MIKSIAKNDLPFKCRVCKKTVKNQEQYISDSINGATHLSHVQCIMGLCGEPISEGMVWKTKEEVEEEEWLRLARARLARGESLIDA